MKIPVFLMLGLLLAVPAFADVQFTITSIPSGATVINHKGNSIGVTPVTFKVKTSKKECYSFTSVVVRWASGATASHEAFDVCEAQGKTQLKTFLRPVGIDGAEFDALYELERLQLLVSAQGVRQQERQANAAEAEARRKRIQELLTPPGTRNRVNCTSTTIGNTVHTTCR